MTKTEVTNSEICRAQLGWDVFTKGATISVIVVAVILGMMALFIL